MSDNVNYDKARDINITSHPFTVKSDSNKDFTKTSWYMKNNIKININAFAKLIDSGVYAQKVLYYIIYKLKKDTNYITIDRKEALSFLGTNDAAVVSKGIKKLLNIGFIERNPNGRKNDFIVPMNYIVKGNVDTMIKQVVEKENENKRVEKELKEVKTYAEISNKVKLKLK